MRNQPYRNTHKLTLPNLLTIAKDTLLVIRDSRKFCPAHFLLMLMQSVYSGNSSFNQMASALGNKLPSMTKQSLWERFTPKSTAFLISTLNNLMEQRLSPVRETLANAGLKRIIVEDSTSLVMPKKNAKSFPAHGNAYGETAGLKLDLAYDLMSGQCVSNTIEKATEQDKSIGKETTSLVQKGDLFLRDMGYFFIEGFSFLEEQGAHWVSRFPANCNLTNTDGKSLEDVLRHAKGDVVDIPVFIGAERHEARLVAVRADKELADKRKRERRKKCRENGKTASKDKLTRDEWHLMVTSLSPEQASVEELGHLYTTRWSIELQFRALKGSLNLKGALNRVTGEHHVFALVLAAMIAHQLYSKFWNIYHQVLAREGRELSLEKLFADFVIFLATLKSIDEITSFSPDIRHIAYEKRKRKSMVNTGFKPLT